MRALAIAFLMAIAVAAPAAAAPADRDAAVDAWRAVQQDQAVPADWTGSVERCEVGTESDVSLAATLRTVNILRDFAGLAPVSFSSALNRRALAAALMMRAEDDLSHEPPPDWACYSEDGADGAANSSLHLGLSGAQAVVDFVEDDDVADLGHRRALLDPVEDVFGSGSTGTTNAVYTNGPGDLSVPPDTTVPWPPAGWFPRDWIPDQQWSIAVGGDGQEVEFQDPQVTVTSAAGPLSVDGVTDLGTGFGFGRALAWRTALDTVGGGDQRLEVSISGIVVDGRALPVSYVIDLFEPPSLGKVSFVGRPKVKRPRGPIHKGALLKVKAKASGGEVTGYQWLRDGRPIPRAIARSYRVRRADRGRRLSCRVTAASPDGATATRKTRAVSVARR
jgi:hypothetical protein